MPYERHWSLDMIGDIQSCADCPSIVHSSDKKRILRRLAESEEIHLAIHFEVCNYDQRNHWPSILKLPRNCPVMLILSENLESWRLMTETFIIGVNFNSVKLTLF